MVGRKSRTLNERYPSWHLLNFNGGAAIHERIVHVQGVGYHFDDVDTAAYETEMSSIILSKCHYCSPDNIPCLTHVRSMSGVRVLISPSRMTPINVSCVSWRFFINPDKFSATPSLRQPLPPCLVVCPSPKQNPITLCTANATNTKSNINIYPPFYTTPPPGQPLPWLFFPSNPDANSQVLHPFDSCCPGCLSQPKTKLNHALHRERNQHQIKD